MVYSCYYRCCHLPKVLSCSITGRCRRRRHFAPIIIKPGNPETQKPQTGRLFILKLLSFPSPPKSQHRVNLPSGRDLGPDTYVAASITCKVFPSIIFILLRRARLLTLFLPVSTRGCRLRQVCSCCPSEQGGKKKPVAPIAITACTRPTNNDLVKHKDHSVALLQPSATKSQPQQESGGGKGEGQGPGKERGRRRWNAGTLCQGRNQPGREEFYAEMARAIASEQD